MNAMPSELGRLRVVRPGVSSDPGPLDDFAEFLTITYAPLLTLLCQAGLGARVERVTSAQYALTVTGTGTGTGGSVDVTDRGRPLPADPASVSGWLLRAGDRAQVLPPTAPLAQVAETAANLLRG